MQELSCPKGSGVSTLGNHLKSYGQGFPVPVVLKEVGFGMGSQKTAQAALDAGIKTVGYFWPWWH